jgi:hypothetical protein
MATDLNTVTLPFDRWGTALTNKREGERYELTAVTWSEFNIIIPQYAPFYSASIDYLVHYPSGDKLYRGIHWIEGWYYQSASGEIGLDLHCCIYFYDPTLSGEILIPSYQAMGGEWQLNGILLTQILANKLLNPLRYYWEQIANLPEIFNPLDHDQDIQDFTKLGDLIDVLQDMARAIDSTTGDAGADFRAHMINYNNVHQVNKAQVGLPLVQNYGIATASDIAQGVMTSTVYMNPPMTNLMIQQIAIAALAQHTADQTNSHHVTAAQTGAYSQLEINAMLESLANGLLYNIKAYRLEGKSVSDIVTMAKEDLNASIDAISKNVQAIVDNVLKDAQVTNATRFDNKTSAEWNVLIAQSATDVATGLIATKMAALSATNWTSIPSIEDLINLQIAAAPKDANGNPIVLNPLNVTDKTVVFFGEYTAFKANVVNGATVLEPNQFPLTIQYKAVDTVSDLSIHAEVTYNAVMKNGTVIYTTVLANPEATMIPVIRRHPTDLTKVQVGMRWDASSMPEIGYQVMMGVSMFAKLAAPIAWHTDAANAGVITLPANYVEVVKRIELVGDASGAGKDWTADITALKKAQDDLKASIGVIQDALTLFSKNAATMGNRVSALERLNTRNLTMFAAASITGTAGVNVAQPVLGWFAEALVTAATPITMTFQLDKGYITYRIAYDFNSAVLHAASDHDDLTTRLLPVVTLDSRTVDGVTSQYLRLGAINFDAAKQLTMVNIVSVGTAVMVLAAPVYSNVVDSSAVTVPPGFTLTKFSSATRVELNAVSMAVTQLTPAVMAGDSSISAADTNIIDLSVLDETVFDVAHPKVTVSLLDDTVGSATHGMYINSEAVIVVATDGTAVYLVNTDPANAVDCRYRVEVPRLPV